MNISFDLQNPCVFGTVPPWPQKAILWEITNRCNLRCKHCCNASDQTGEYGLGTENLIEAISQLSRFQVCEVYLSGGEPLCRTDLAEIVRAIATNGIRASMATNGTLLDQTRLEVLLEAGIGQINISLDSSDPEQHDMFRGVPGTFEKAVRAIQQCLAHRVSCKVVCTLTSMNWTQVEPLVQMLIDLGAHVIVFNVVHPFGRVAEHPGYMLGGDEVASLLAQTKGLTARYADQIEIDFRCRANPHGKPLGECPGGRSLMHITAEGQVYPCSWLAKLPAAGEYRLGNILTVPFEVIEARGLHIGERFLHRSNEIALCQTCEWKRECRCGCPLPTLANGTEVISVDPVCPKCYEG